MGHGPEHHIEHAEHAAHAAHDTFNTRVTISIAMIAAALAAVTIMGHRAHNLMLAKQLEASMLNSQAFNKWSQYQAYNVRSHLYQVAVDEAQFEAIKPGAEEAVAKAIERWQSQVTKYETKSMPETKGEAMAFNKQADELIAASIKWHHKAEWLDLGDLGLQLGVVLASMAILTKRRAFWITGVLCALIGFAISMGGQFDLIPDHDHHAATDGKKDKHAH